MENVLKNKNFVLLFLGALVSQIGGVFYSFSVSLYILSITNVNAKIHGYYLALSGVVFLIFTPIGGILADRYNKAKIVYVTDFFRGMAILISGYMIYLLTTVNSQLIILFTAAIILNIIGAIFAPSASSLVRFIVKDQQIQQAQSYFSILHSIQAIVGIILAGILYSLLKINTIFIIVGILYLVSGFSELFIRYNYQKNDYNLTIKAMFEDYSDGIKYLKKQKAIITLLLGVLFINFFTYPLFSNGTNYFVKTYLNNDYLFDKILTPEMWAAIFNVCFSVGSMVTAFIISLKPDRRNFGGRIKRWIVVISLIIILMAISFNVFVIILQNLNAFLIIYSFLMTLLGIAIICFNIPTTTSIQLVVEKDKLAKVNSLLTIVSMGLIPIAAFIAGVIIDEISLGVLYIICATGIFASALTLNFSKSINNMGVAPSKIS